MKSNQNNIFVYPNQYDSDNNRLAVENGITLMDYFAGQALAGILSKYTLNTPEDQKTIAQLSYEIANEMLNQR